MNERVNRRSFLGGRGPLHLFLAAVLWLTASAGAQQQKPDLEERLARWLKRFPQADTNGDGVLTQQEVKAFRKKRQTSGAQRGQGSPALTPTRSDVPYGSHPRNVLDPFFAVGSVAELDTPQKQKLVEEASALNFVSGDDPPIYAKHGGVLSNAPLPPDAPYGLSIHHPMFGKMLQEEYEKVGGTCYLACGDSNPGMDEITFLKQVFEESK